LRPGQENRPATRHGASRPPVFGLEPLGSYGAGYRVARTKGRVLLRKNRGIFDQKYGYFCTKIPVLLHDSCETLAEPLRNACRRVWSGCFRYLEFWSFGVGHGRAYETSRRRIGNGKRKEKRKVLPTPLLKRKGKKDNNHNNNACAREA